MEFWIRGKQILVSICVLFCFKDCVVMVRFGGMCFIVVFVVFCVIVKNCI